MSAFVAAEGSVGVVLTSKMNWKLILENVDKYADKLREWAYTKYKELSARKEEELAAKKKRKGRAGKGSISSNKKTPKKPLSKTMVVDS